MPSVKGLATIYDKDILIYCISQLMERMKRGKPVGPRVRMTSYDLLVFTNRGTSGKDYNALCDAIDRLEGTRIKTNLRTGDTEQRDSFGLIEASSVRRKHGNNGRLLWVEIKLSDWVFNAIHGHEVLTLHPDYFRLGKPLERRLYELARKHCGRQRSWKISLETMHKKSGSRSSLKRFRQMVRQIAQCDVLPDYRLTFDLETDQIKFFNRTSWWQRTPPRSCQTALPPLSTAVYEVCRSIAPGYDIYSLEVEWRQWWNTSGRPKLDEPSSAFMGFCRMRNAKRPIY